MTDRSKTSPKKSPRAVDVSRLHGDAEWALEKGLGPRDLVPMLERLRKHAEPGSTSWCFATIELAGVLLQTSPWRSAALARSVLSHDETERGHALLGLALSMLGHYGASCAAYERALAFSPTCTSYLHNLGHLLDAGLGRPREALPYLEQAYRARPFDAELAASYAHALVRLGRTAEARPALEKAVGEIPGAVEELLRRFEKNG